MTYGLDTSFLIAAELAEHADHVAVRNKHASFSAGGDRIAIAPQVIAEFMHVATDSRRLVRPLDMPTAKQIAERWWSASEVIQIFPDEAAVRQFLTWMSQYSLGRKRWLDTLLAATFQQAGIQSVLTTNPADFAVFGVFSCITP